MPERQSETRKKSGARDRSPLQLNGDAGSGAAYRFLSFTFFHCTLNGPVPFLMP